MSTQADKLSLLQQLKAKKNAVILAHYYTMPEVQAAADFVGDSLALAQAAAQTDADIILFAGVHFMAETAKILNPTKKVLLPEFSAGCSLADSCPADKLAAFMQQHPDHLLLSYINCSAAVKAMSYCIVHMASTVPQNHVAVQFAINEAAEPAVGSEDDLSILGHRIDHTERIARSDDAIRHCLHRSRAVDIAQ